MDTFQIFKKTLKMTWRYRALWLFGFLLALTVSNVFWLALDGEDERVALGNRIILPNSNVIRFPGEGVTIDFRASDPPEITVEGLGPGWYQALSNELNLGDLSDLLISFGIIVIISFVIHNLFRHTSRAALIRMVDGYGSSEEVVGLRRGFRLGWSRVAWNLFLIDLVINIPVFIFFSLLSFVTVSPFFLFNIEAISTSTPIVMVILFFVAAGFILVFFLLLAVSLLLSLVKPIIRQACAVDGLGVFPSISHGFKTFTRRFLDVLLTWFIVIVVRFTWTLLVIPVFFLLIPIIIVTLLTGVLAWITAAASVALIADIFMSTIFAWIVGGIAALPLFLKITFSPVTFLSGLVTVIREGFWTLSYHEFRNLPESQGLENNHPLQDEDDSNHEVIE